MKKLFITLSIIFCSLVCKAQEFIQSYALDIGYWNTTYKKWDWEKTKSCTVSFILQGNSIISDDNANSTYYTYKTLSSDIRTGASWKALDEKRRECLISMVSHGSYSYFIVIYNDICYRYVY